MSTETPRDANGNALCAWCGGGPVPPSRGTKPRAYCKDGCKQRAYEARKLEQRLEEAREAVRQEEAEQRPAKLLNAYLKGRAEEAELGPAKSRDDQRSAPAKSRDVPRSGGAKSRDFLPNQQVTAPALPGMDDEWVRSPEQIEAELEELEQRQTGSPADPPQRRDS